jgi:putative ABC transport system permease protein
MLRKIVHSFALAFTTIRANLFHALLSVLGIVIGVAALVSILSLIDGMEKFAREQIASTTALNGIIVQSDSYNTINGIRIRKDSIPVIGYDHFNRLGASLSKPAKTYMRWTSSQEVRVDTVRVAAFLVATSATLEPGAVVATGKGFTDEDVKNNELLMVVNQAFVKEANFSNAESALGRMIYFDGKHYKITGVIANESVSPKIYFPVSLVTAAQLQNNTPEMLVECEKTEDVTILKAEITEWLRSNYKNANQDFKIITNDFRIEQTTKAFLLFRVIMGLIVGISVLVGGIGVMNVLLISVTQRTIEIGIRKAAGAKRSDIVLLFLTESITVSVFGSLAGLIVGVAGTEAIIPIVNSITKMPFQVAYTVNTFLVISIISVLVGVTFGTYPAIRASRLDPVEAIRHE